VIFAQVPLGAQPSNKVGVAIVTAAGQTLQRGRSFRTMRGRWWATLAPRSKWCD